MAQMRYREALNAARKATGGTALGEVRRQIRKARGILRRA